MGRPQVPLQVFGGDPTGYRKQPASFGSFSRFFARSNLLRISLAMA